MPDDFMKAPCKHCPFRSDVRPFLHPERAEEISFAAQNPYAEFTCHKTLEYDEGGDDLTAGQNSKICAGFLAMQINEAGIDCPDGFEFPENVYADAYGMTEAYQIEWDDARRKRKKSATAADCPTDA